MSKVLKKLLNLNAAPAAGANAPGSANGPSPAFVRPLGPVPSRRPLVIGLALALAVAGFVSLRHNSVRGPASAEAPRPAISEQELFLRNRQAVLSFYNGNLEASAGELRGLLAAGKDKPKAAQASLRANLGSVLLRQGKLTEARTAFVQALAQDAAHAGALHGLGQLALRENELAEAEEHFLLALRAAPDRPETLLALGQVSELRDHWAESRGYYARFLAAAADPALKAQITARLRKIEGRMPASVPTPEGE